MRTLVALLLILLAACADPTAPSADCQPERALIQIRRGLPDSVAQFTNQIADHPASYYERWYYVGSPFVETFTWGALLPHCIYDQENRPDWLR